MKAGDTIGSYVLVRQLGCGGMGAVWEAHDTALDRAVVIKCVLPSLSHDDSFAQRLLLEARILAKLSHPGIVPIYNAFNEDGKVFLVMKLLNGKTLADIIKSAGPPSLLQCIEWFRQGAAALSYAHAQGIFHRDIKPNNIMIDQYSNVYLIDFGIALSDAVTKRLTKTGYVVGTPPFMAPEQYTMGHVDAQSDIYSLALTFYYAMTGCECKRKPDGTHAYESLPDFPKGFDRIMRKCLSVSPQARYDDAQELVSDLRSCLLRKGKEPPVRRFTYWIGGAVALVVLLLAVLASTVWRPGSERSTVDEVERPAVATAQNMHEDDVLDVRHVEAVRGTEGAESVAPTARRHEPRPAEAKTAALLSDVDTVQHAMIMIPAGEFIAGMEVDEVPEHLKTFSGWEILTQGGRRVVNLPAFQISKYEVTNRQYAEFVAATDWPPPPHWTNATPPRGKEDHPVVNVSHADASAYAKWRGKRLPTADEWEKAARGADARIYPWGNEFEAGIANTEDAAEGGTAPVGKFKGDVSPYGVYDLGGNAAEWTASVEENEDGLRGQVICGGSWFEWGEIVALSSFRRIAAGDDVFRPDLSFRCVQEEPATAD